MPNSSSDLRIYVERVTGIEPAWPAWKGGFFKRCLRCSAASPTEVVSFDCLSAVPMAAGKSGVSFLVRMLATAAPLGEACPTGHELLGSGSVLAGVTPIRRREGRAS